MITATPSGNGWYIEGNKYKILASKTGITQLYLKESGRPQNNILYGGGIVFNEAYGQTSGTVTLNNADSSVSLVEANAVRAVLSVTGFYEPGTGGTKYGSGSARIVCYADRFAIESVSEFTTSLGTGMCVRPVVAMFAYNRCREMYCYDTDGAGGFSWNDFYGGWAAVESNFAGPLSVMTVHGVGALPGGLLTVVVLNGQGLAMLDLWDVISGTTYVAWRAQKSSAVTGQRYRAVSVFNFATTMDLEEPGEDAAVAFRGDITRPDPLDGSANSGVILTGSKVIVSEGDENSDGYAERDTQYVLRPGGVSGYLDFRFDDRRGTSTAAPFFRPAIKIANWLSPTPPQAYRWSGTAWLLLSPGVDYVSTSEADEAAVGLNVRIVQILSDLSGQGTAGPRFKFAAIYVDPPEEEEWTLKVAGVEIDMAAAKVSLRRLGNSWRYGRLFAFSESAPHTSGAWSEGQEAELLCRGERLFLGDVVERHLVGAPGAEEALYICRDTRARAERVAVTDPVTLAPRIAFNAPPGDPDHIDEQSGLNVGGIIGWLFETFEEELTAAGFGEPGSLPYEFDDLTGLTAVPPKLVLSGLHFDGALRAALAYEPEVIYFVDPVAQKYRFLRLSALEGRSVTYNGAERPLSSLVTPTLAGRFTAYKIVGQCEHITRSAYVSEGEVEPYWGGRATTLANVPAGSGVVIPVDSTTFFAVGDSIQVGSGAAGETTVIISIVAGVSITAHLTKSHTAGTIITNKTYLEAHWTLAKAYGPAYTDSGTATGGQPGTLVDTSKSWGVDRWVGGEVTLTKAGLVQKRAVTDSNTNTLFVTPNWAVPPAAGDTYEVRLGVSRYRYVFSRYRVADADKRRIAQTVPDPENLAPLPGLAIVSHHPRAWRKTSSGFWFIAPVVFDYASGVFTTVSPAAEGVLTVEGGAHAAPDMRLDYSYLGNPCTARFPSTGFTGTAYSGAGLERECVRYEDDFSSTAHTPQYQALAEKLLWPLKDVAFTGEISLAVLEPKWLGLDYRLNIRAQDDEGLPVVTGLEGLEALVASAEMDFPGGRTVINLADAETLLWSGDWFRTLAETELIYEQLTSGAGGGGGSGGTSGGDSGGSGSTIQIGGNIYVTFNEIVEVLGSGGGILGGGMVTSVTAGGANGIIGVYPTTGDVVVYHADYVSGNKTPCNYAPRWQ